MDYKSGDLRVVTTAYPEQFWIRGAIEPYPDDNYTKSIVSFSGYFGSHGPHLFAAAPDLLAMLKVARLWLDVDGRFDMQGINAAIAKAEGK